MANTARCFWDGEDHPATWFVQVGAITRNFCALHADEAIAVLEAFGSGHAEGHIQEA